MASKSGSLEIKEPGTAHSLWKSTGKWIYPVTPHGLYREDISRSRAQGERSRKDREEAGRGRQRGVSRNRLRDCFWFVFRG